MRYLSGFVVFLLILIQIICSSNFFSNVICNICQDSTNLLISYFKYSIPNHAVLFIGDLICEHLGQPHHFCVDLHYALDNYYKTIIETLVYKGYTCEAIGLCTFPFPKYTHLKDYTDQTLRFTPPTIYKRQIQKNATLKYGILADIHVDFEYEENRKVNCKGAGGCCRNDSGIPSPYEKKSGMYGEPGVCSISWYTVEAALNHMSTNNNLDYLFWLGDNVPNNVFNRNKFILFNNTQYLVNAIDMAFKNTKTQILPVIGNHESITCDEFDFYSDRDQYILNGIGDLWKIWISNNSIDSFKKKISYATKIKDTNLKIISLNPFVYDSWNPYIYINNTDPYQVLEWLNDTLYESEINNETVIIIGHTSMNTPFTIFEWTERFFSLIERYQNIISNLQFGHTHVEFFNVYKSKFDNSPFMISFQNPSLTTYAFSNPSYRIYTLDKINYVIDDYVTFRMNITESNKIRSPVWFKSYSFKDFFEVIDSSIETHNNILKEFSKNNIMYNKLLLKFNGDYLGNDYYKYSSMQDKFFYCVLINDRPNLMKNCLGLRTSLFYLFFYSIQQQFFFHEWGYKTNSNSLTNITSKFTI